MEPGGGGRNGVRVRGSLYLAFNGGSFACCCFHLPTGGNGGVGWLIKLVQPTWHFRRNGLLHPSRPPLPEPDNSIVVARTESTGGLFAQHTDFRGAVHCFSPDVLSFSPFFDRKQLVPGCSGICHTHTFNRKTRNSTENNQPPSSRRRNRTEPKNNPPTGRVPSW